MEPAAWDMNHLRHSSGNNMTMTKKCDELCAAFCLDQLVPKIFISQLPGPKTAIASPWRYKDPKRIKANLWTMRSTKGALRVGYFWITERSVFHGANLDGFFGFHHFSSKSCKFLYNTTLVRSSRQVVAVFKIRCLFCGGSRRLIIVNCFILVWKVGIKCPCFILVSVFFWHIQKN